MTADYFDTEKTGVSKGRIEINLDVKSEKVMDFANEIINATLDKVLEIIDEDIGEHIYRDAFRSREDLKNLYDRVRGHIVALKGEEYAIDRNENDIR